MTPLFFDFETRCQLPISVGTERYARAAEPTLLSYALGDGPVSLWEIDRPRPERFINLCHNPDVLLVAHNVPFDEAILRNAWGITVPPERLHCTQAQAYAHSLPGSLQALGAALGLGHDTAKDAEGHKIMLKFCSPLKDGTYRDRHSHPEEWAKYCEYARQDVVALREVYKRLPTHNYSGDHKRVWNLDFEINRRGFAVDLELAQAAVKVTEKAKRRMDKQVADLTGGAATATTQRDKVLLHIVGDHGLNLVDLKASTIRELLDGELDEATRTLLELRLEGSRNATSKYQKMLDTACDGRVRYTLQFSGADRTGRWAGRGLQPQNLLRPNISDFEYIEDVLIPAIKSGAVLGKDMEPVYGTPVDACANALRSAIMAEEEKVLTVADYSNIEGRVLAWLAGEEWKLEAFRQFDAGTGPDLYKLLYHRLFRVPLEAVGKKERTVGKVADLACGFLGSVGAFVSFAAIYNLDLAELTAETPGIVPPHAWQKGLDSYKWAVENERDYGLERDVYAACRALVEVYRQSHPATVQFAYDLHNAMIFCTDNPGVVHTVGRLKVWRSGAWLIVELPSGRRMLYAGPKVRRNDEEREVLTYMNARGKQWRRMVSWGGLTVENVTQAVANDVLRVGLTRVADAGYATVLHVHDEIVDEGEPHLAELIDLMTRQIEWAPGLPLAAAGYVATRYRKD